MRSVLTVRGGGGVRMLSAASSKPSKSKYPASRLLTAALLLAVSPTSLAVAQTADSTKLDPLVVEADKKKKKKTAAVKKSPAKQGTSAPPQPVAQQPPPKLPNATPDGAATPGGNPYANPNAPYEVQQSANGKLTEPLLNTPRSVTAVPKEVLEDKDVRDLRELARDVPGLTIGSAEGGNSYGAFAIRGFKANNDIFVDGFRTPGNVIPDVFAVEQVEIYKGPSGGIAGRSTIGGAINLVTKQPDLNFSNFEVATTVGTDDMIRTTLDVNQVVTRDFAVRANLMYDQHDVAGRDVTESERWGGLIAATAKVTDDVKVTLDYYRYRNDAIPDWGVPVGINPPVTNPVTPPATGNVPVTELGYPRDMFVGMAHLDFYKEEVDVGTATVVAKLAEGLTLTNKTRVGASRVDYVATSMEGYPTDVHHPNRDQPAELYANLTELNAKFLTGTFKHDVVAGIEVSREKIHRSGYNVTRATGARPFPPDPYDVTDTILGEYKVYDATIDTIGAYVEDTVHLSKEWIVNAGIRVDDFTRDQIGGPGVPSGTTSPELAAKNNTAKVQDDLFSWHAGIVYKPIPIASIYAAYATAESPIGSELDATGTQYNGLSSVLVDAPPQQARSIEVGTKWELFDRRLLATAALFQTDVDHARTNAGLTTPTNSNQTPTQNPLLAFSGEYRVQGIELSAAGNITKDWSVYGGLVVLNTKVLDSDNASEIGRRLANIPLTQFSLMSRYQLTDQLAVGGTATYGGEVFGGHLAANDAGNHTVDWWRFDAFAEYDLTKNIEIEVSGLNLTDTLYYDAIYQANPTFAFVAPGRAGYLTVKYKY